MISIICVDKIIDKNLENLSLSLSPLILSFYFCKYYSIKLKKTERSEQQPPLCHYIPQIHSSQQHIQHSLSTAPTLGGSQQFYGGGDGLFHQPGEYYPTAGTAPGHFTPLQHGSINGSALHISPL